jgi:hypothetical protein
MFIARRLAIAPTKREHLSRHQPLGFPYGKTLAISHSRATVAPVCWFKICTAWGYAWYLILNALPRLQEGALSGYEHPCRSQYAAKSEA